jgi:CheY-like chemotaxis protein
MSIGSAIVIDDLAADRQLTRLVLQRAGVQVLVGRDSRAGEVLLQQVVAHQIADQTVIITDLHMPDDPLMQVSRGGLAGAQWALQIRVRMERGALPRIPIVALTAFGNDEVLLTARALGCDAVLRKPATADLVERIEQALAETQTEHYAPPGMLPMLNLLRVQLASALVAPAEVVRTVQERDLTQALLAYRRYGIVGFGASSLAHALFPQIPTDLQRGEALHAKVVACLQRAVTLGRPDALALLQPELDEHSSPEQQAGTLGLSKSQYYRRRNEILAILFVLLME